MLVLLVLLAGGNATVDAAPDPMVEAIQRALVERGFDPGKVDGAMGRRTRSALRAFQRSVGLPDSGKIDDATTTVLGLEPAGGEQTSAGTEAPPAVAPDAEPAPTPEDTSKIGAPDSATAAEPEADTPAAEAPRAEPVPSAETSRSEAPGTEQAPKRDSEPIPKPESPPKTEPKPEPTPKPAPKPVASLVLSFATLGWHSPLTGTEALERFAALGAPLDFERGTGSLFVPKAKLVFVLQAGERVPGLDCDPGAGPLSVEFVFGPDGPVIFTPAAGGEYCRMGIGIAIEVGRTLEMRPLDWGGAQYPQGTVRVTGEGLQYID